MTQTTKTTQVKIAKYERAMLSHIARVTFKASSRSMSKRSMTTAVTGVDLPYTSVADGKYLKVGDRVPEVLFKTRARIPELAAKGEENPYDWKDTTTADHFAGKVRI